MAKRVIMIPPFEVLTGNLSGAQDLRYKENNNKAYEAPNGSASAQNYVTRYVGAKRADGKSYFAVRRKTTTTLNSKTRMTMAILGTIAAIKSAIKVGHSTDWANLQSIYSYRMAHGGDEAGSGISYAKWLDYWLRRMLQFKMTELTLTASGLSVLIVNPFVDYDDARALTIATAIYVKFFGQLKISATMAYVYIDGVKMVVDAETAWSDNLTAANVNVKNNLTSVTLSSGSIKFNGQQVYTSTGHEVEGADTPVADAHYTTIAPSA